jgi:hypothetical protein
MSSVPFTVYDFFAYLSSGTVLLALVDYVSGQRWLLKQNLPPGQWILLLILAYVTGHAVAHISSSVFEQGLVQRVLGRPSSTLLGSAPRNRLYAILFRGYYRPLPKETRDRIYAQASARGFSGHGEGLFLHALGVVTKDERAQKRLDEFRNVYGFARNMAFVLIVVAIVFAITSVVGHKPADMEGVWIAAPLGITMLYRYLKFFRQYSYQLLFTYAELTETKSATTVTVVP